MKKIVIIGAGIGGLLAAELLGKQGYEVELFEKSKRGEVSYDWHDDVSPKIFAKLGIPLPDKKYYFRKGNWAFVPPSENSVLPITLPPEQLDNSMERRALAEHFSVRAEEFATLNFGTEVDALLIKNEVVCGVIVGGKEIEADLVIDNSGVLSKFRASLPTSYKIPAYPEKNEVFKAYRAFHKRNEGATNTYSNPVYMKHLGEDGISWCIADPSGTVNVLIGRIGELSEATLANALAKLKASNPILGDEVVRGGGIYTIPVRYPATRMCGTGYCMLGDSAYMTIPVMGSGIEAGMIAAAALAKVVAQTGSICRGTLWMYQVEYYKQIGAKHCALDLLKRCLLSTAPANLDFLLGKGVIDEKDMAAGATGDTLKLSFPNLLKKISKGVKNMPVLLELNSALNKGKKATKIALAIPPYYNEAAIDAWEKRLKKLYK